MGVTADQEQNRTYSNADSIHTSSSKVVSARAERVSVLRGGFREKESGSQCAHSSTDGALREPECRIRSLIVLSSERAFHFVCKKLVKNQGNLAQE